MLLLLRARSQHGGQAESTSASLLSADQQHRQQRHGGDTATRDGTTIA